MVRSTIGANRTNPRRSPQSSSPSFDQSGRPMPSGLLDEWTSLEPVGAPRRNSPSSRAMPNARVVVSQEDRGRDRRPEAEGEDRRSRPLPADRQRQQVKAQDRRDRPDLDLDHAGVARQEPGDERDRSRGRAAGSPEQGEAAPARRTPPPDGHRPGSHRQRPGSPGRRPARPAPTAEGRSRGRGPGRRGSRRRGP